MRRTPPGRRAAPVGLLGERAAFDHRHVLSPADQPRAGLADADFGIEGAKVACRARKCRDLPRIAGDRCVRGSRVTGPAGPGRHRGSEQHSGARMRQGHRANLCSVQ